MSLYDEQIREREELDTEALEKAFGKMTNAVIGARGAFFDESDDSSTNHAINSILNYYHIDKKLSDNELDNIDDKLEHVCSPYGIMRRRVNLTKGWYKDAYGPYIATYKDTGEKVAILPAHPYGYRYYSDKDHKYVRINKNNEDLFELEAYAFYKPFPIRRMSLVDLIKYMAELITAEDVALMLAMYLIVTLLGMMIPKFTGLLYGVVVSSKSIQLLMAAGFFMIMVSISRIIVTAIRSLVINRLNYKISLNVEAATMMRVLSLPPGFFRDYTAGELSRITGYVGNLCDLLISSFLSTLLSLVFSLLYIAQIFKYARGLVLPAIVIVLTSTIFNLICTYANMKRSKQIMKLSAKSSGLGYSLLSGIEKIKLTGSEKRAFAKWANHYATEAALEYNPPFFIKVSGVISGAITAVGTIVMYFFTIKNGIDLSEYTAFMASYGLMMGAFSGLAAIVLQIANIKPSMDMCKPILEACPENQESKEVLSEVKGSITIDNVTFRYDNESPYIFENFSLKIERGQYVAIVGKTGCGKSTLVRLLLGFETPERGAIYVDGRDISSVDIKSLRRHIGTVTQNGKLFQGNMFDNIVVSAPYATLDDAWEAARIAGLDEDIKAMPLGMASMISEGQGGISGGQKQRLLIARAVASKPNLLILDEATSALDNITQKKVSDALSELKCTRVVIAHRLSTIKNCDRIVVIDDGKIIEDGSYDELIEKGGFFKELVARQMSN